MPNSSSDFVKLKQALSIASLVAGTAVCLLGLMVISGWHAGNRTLIQVLPAFVPMQYNTALGFVLCGGGLLLLLANRPRSSSVAGYLAALIGVLTLSEYLSGLNLGIDELLMKHDVTVQTSSPGRMAPNTAVCFALIGVAIALREERGARSLWRVILSSVACGLSVVALTGYYTRLETAYGWGNLTRMAVHTSAGFIVASIGLLCLAWRSDVRQASCVPRWMPVPLAVSILTATICFWQALQSEGARIHRLHQELTSLTHLSTVMLIVGSLLALATAASVFWAQQAGQRAREISRTNESLEEEIQVRKSAEEALRAHRENLEQLVAERTGELDRARREAENANRAKSQFLSHMSHELRTPLNGILGYAQILQRDRQASERQRENLQGIVHCGDHLLSLINDVLDLSRIEAGHLEVRNRPCDLSELIQGVGDIVQQRAHSKGLRFDVQAAPDVPQALITDAAKLRQILVNLLGNAVKFTSQGEVRLRVAMTADNQLRFEVTDTGMGMTDAELKEIFDPFKQVAAGKVAGGTGLGLAITQRLTEALGGTISVRSEPGKGSVFSVTLPWEELPADPKAVLSEKSGLSGEHLILPDGWKGTILVADDRDTNRHVLEGLLNNAGFPTRLAADGQEALDLLAAHDDVKLVLMDIRMPRCDGLEALRQIRASEKLAQMKVIAVTASVFPEFQEQAIEAGFDDFIAKPFRADELLKKLQKHLGLRLEVVADEIEAPSSTTESHTGTLESISAPSLGRLRDALRIKNLTAIKTEARELAASSATSGTANRIDQLARVLDFPGLAQLLDELEKLHDSDSTAKPN